MRRWEPLNRITLLVFLLTVWGHPLRAVEQKLIVMGIDDFCPYTCLEKDRPGFLPEAIAEILRRSHMRLEIVQGSWTRLKLLAESGKVDLLGPLSLQLIKNLKLPSTQSLGGFFHAGFMTVADSTWLYQGPKSLDKKNIATVKGYSYPSELLEYFAGKQKQGSLIELVGADANRRQLQMLASKRVDTVPVLIDLFWHQARLLKLNPKDFRLAGTVELEADLSTYRLGVFTRDAGKAKILINILDEGFLKIKKDGTAKALLERYEVKTLEALGLQSTEKL